MDRGGCNNTEQVSLTLRSNEPYGLEQKLNVEFIPESFYITISTLCWSILQRIKVKERRNADLFAIVSVMIVAHIKIPLFRLCIRAIFQGRMA